MLTFDELLSMTDQEKLNYLKVEVEKVISSSEPNNQLRLRVLQVKCDGILSRIKSPLSSAQAVYNVMIDQGLNPLSEALNDAV